jgi:hypothetical protein
MNHGTTTHMNAAAIDAAADEGGTIQATEAVALHGPEHPERHCTQSVAQAAAWLGCEAEVAALGWETGGGAS